MVLGDDLVVSELMINADGGASGQWPELRNLSGHDIALEGISIVDLSQPSVEPFAFVSPALIEADDFVVVVSGLGASDAKRGGPATWTLADDGELAVYAGDLLIGSLDCDASFGSVTGVAMQVDPADYADAADTANWCPATADYDGGRLGTPRGENFACE